MRVVDYGWESIYGWILFVFEIYDFYIYGDKLKFGVWSFEEVVKWMEVFKEVVE